MGKRQRMTEAMWLECPDPEWMVRYLHRNQRIQPSERKRRLFVIALCRRIWDTITRLTDESTHQSVEVAERYADGLASERERFQAKRAADRTGGRASGIVHSAVCVPDVAIFSSLGWDEVRLATIHAAVAVGGQARPSPWHTGAT